MNKCKNCSEPSGYNIYCSLRCRNIYVNKNIRDYKKNVKGNKEAINKRNTLLKREYLKNPKKCPQCNSNIEYDKRKNKFCSTSCGNKHRKGITYNITESGKEALRKSAKRLYKENISNGIITPRKPQTCIICKKIFKSNNNKKTCSKKCYKKLCSKNASSNPNCGGETNYKKHKYKDQYFDSSWEVKIAKLLDEKEIKWVRDKRIYFIWKDKSGKKRRYHPDFYLPEHDMYLEPKNKYLLTKDKHKLDYVINEYKIKLVYGILQDIIKEIETL